MARVCLAGFPHSEISGSMDICSSPKLFAAYHVFHRLSVPRHPPCALCCLTIHDSYSVMIMGLGFFRVHRFINLLISWLLPIKITSSDVSIGMIVCLRSFDIFNISICGFQGTVQNQIWNCMDACIHRHVSIFDFIACLHATE